VLRVTKKVLYRELARLFLGGRSVAKKKAAKKTMKKAKKKSTKKKGAKK
jgi:hypothetical protein